MNESTHPSCTEPQLALQFHHPHSSSRVLQSSIHSTCGVWRRDSLCVSKGNSWSLDWRYSIPMIFPCLDFWMEDTPYQRWLTLRLQGRFLITRWKILHTRDLSMPWPLDGRYYIPEITPPILGRSWSLDERYSIPVIPLCLCTFLISGWKMLHTDIAPLLLFSVVFDHWMEDTPYQ